MTKIEQARRIVKQLYFLAHMPNADHFKVKRLARKGKAELTELYDMARDAAASTGRSLED
jgi:hypothetical protein